MAFVLQFNEVKSRRNVQNKDDPLDNRIVYRITKSPNGSIEPTRQGRIPVAVNNESTTAVTTMR